MAAPKRKAGKRGFGQIQPLPSGRYRARYADPNGATSPRSGEVIRHPAPFTFDTIQDAEGWLTDERRLITSGGWTPPSARRAGTRAAVTFGDFAEAWLKGRTVRGRPLADRTREHYRQLLDRHILPTFRDVPLRYITDTAVDSWYGITAVNQPTLRAHAYSLLRSILATALERGHITGNNPARIRGAGNPERVSRTEVPTLRELEVIVTKMPAKYRAMVLMAVWTGLRFGELTELRRSDLDKGCTSLKVRRGVVRAGGQVIVKAPKSAASTRTISIPPHIRPIVAAHLLEHAQPGADGLIFPAKSGGHLAPSTLYKSFYKAREKAGRPDLRWHDLRHAAGVFSAMSGATLAETMARMGHSTIGAATRYMNVAKERDKEIAERMSDLAGADS